MGMSIDEEVKNIKEQLADVSAKYRMMQSDYNARLKADLLAMLTEIQLEIHELWDNDPSYIEGVYDSEMLIQQKIDKLKEQTDE